MKITITARHGTEFNYNVTKSNIFCINCGIPTLANILDEEELFCINCNYHFFKPKYLVENQIIQTQ